ncbi:hypothetical protein BC628DRAFT_973773 [Trametes gibbosa]|nr:hypothetical protein BC628DRAFT_973773 [Trametes gibbosa]
MAYDYYRSSGPGWGTSQFQFAAPPPPPFRPQSSWGGIDYYNAHAHNADPSMYQSVMSRSRQFGALGIGRREARYWHRRVYSGMSPLTQLLPVDIGAAAAYEAYRTWKHNPFLQEPLGANSLRIGEGLVGMAVAETTRLWQYARRPMDVFGLRTASEAAASAATVLAERLLQPTIGDAEALDGGYDYRRPRRNSFNVPSVIRSSGSPYLGAGGGIPRGPDSMNLMGSAGGMGGAAGYGRRIDGTPPPFGAGGMDMPPIISPSPSPSLPDYMSGAGMARGTYTGGPPGPMPMLGGAAGPPYAGSMGSTGMPPGGAYGTGGMGSGSIGYGPGGLGSAGSMGGGSYGGAGTLGAGPYGGAGISSGPYDGARGLGPGTYGEGGTAGAVTPFPGGGRVVPPGSTVIIEHGSRRPRARRYSDSYRDLPLRQRVVEGAQEGGPGYGAAGGYGRGGMYGAGGAGYGGAGGYGSGGTRIGGGYGTAMDGGYGNAAGGGYGGAEYGVMPGEAGVYGGDGMAGSGYGGQGVYGSASGSPGSMMSAREETAGEGGRVGGMFGGLARKFEASMDARRNATGFRRGSGY